MRLPSVLLHPDSPLSPVLEASNAHRKFAKFCLDLPAKSRNKVPLRHAFLDWLCTPAEARQVWGMPKSEAAWVKRFAAGDRQNPVRWKAEFPEDVVEIRSSELARIWELDSIARGEAMDAAGVGSDSVSLASMSEQELVLVIVRQLLLRSAEGDSDALKDLKSWSTLVTQLANDAIAKSDQDLSGVDSLELVNLVLDSSLPLVVEALVVRGLQVSTL